MKAIGLGLLVALGASCALGAESYPEKLTVATVPDTAQRLYVADPVLPHMVDGRIYVLDGPSLKLLGMLESGFAGMMVAVPDKHLVYVASTFFERLTRGRRTDVIQVFDDRTMTVIDEIPVPEIRAQALPYRNLMRASADGSLLMLQNATPETSITVLDLASKGPFEARAPGCYGIYPALTNPLRFATLCGDGTAATFTVDQDRRSAERNLGARFFDPQNEPLYTHAETDGAAYVFLSYGAKLVRVSFEGETSALLDSADVNAGVADWAPGGYQPFAVDAKAGVAYVLMHPNAAEGSHKAPSAEIWAWDMRGKKLLARSPAAGLIAVTLAPGGGALYAINGVDNKIARFAIDASSRRASLAGEIKLGETAALVEAVK